MLRVSIWLLLRRRVWGGVLAVRVGRLPLVTVSRVHFGDLRVKRAHGELMQRCGI
jgi:hypothetical protein